MSLKPLKETVELWHRINSATSLEESLKSGNMSSFLMLEDSVEAINALNTQIDQTMADLKTLGNNMPKEMSNTAAALKDAVNQVAKLRLKASPKIKIFQLGDPVKKASKIMADASTLAATAVAAGQTVMGSLGDYEIDVKTTETLKAALDAKRAENDQVPDEQAMIGAVQKAWQTPSGFGNAVKGFLGALGIGKGGNFFGLDADKFAADILASPVAATVDWLQSPGAKDSLTSDEKELAGLDDKLKQSGMDDEALKGGEKEGEEKGGEEGTSDTKKWSELSAAYLKTVEDQGTGKKFLDALKGDQAFTSAVADLINLEESMYRTSLSSLLFENIDFDVLKSAAAQASDDEAAQVSLAQGLAKVLSSQGIEVANIPATEEEAPTEDGAPSEKEVDAAEKAAMAAAKAAAQTDLPPAEAAGKAIDDWVSGLSQNMQKSLKYKGRLETLKGQINQEVEGMADTVGSRIKKAVDSWTEKNKADFPKEFFKNKKKADGAGELNTTFTKTLPSAIGGVVSAMMKKTAESKTRWTPGMVDKFTHAYMDKWFAVNFKKSLNETLISPNRGYHSGESSYEEDDMVRYRWLKMAGLGK